MTTTPAQTKPAALHTPRRDEVVTNLASGLTQLTYFRGRVAMAAVLRELGVKRGDDILVQAFTCIAVPEAVMSLGARPRYVDVAAGTPNMDPSDLSRKVTPNTRAIVAQHSFGLPADIVRLVAVANEADVPVVEDCAHTIASRVDGQAVGSFGAAAFYSYEASKPVFAGIGGSAVANDPALASALSAAYAGYSSPDAVTQLQIAAMFLAHRLVYRPSTYWTVRGIFRAMVAAGFIKGNYNDVSSVSGPSRDFSLKMGLRQTRILERALTTLDKQTDHRRSVGDQYRSQIRAHAVTHLDIRPGSDPVFGRYPLLVENRAEWVDSARAARVEIADFYSTPVHPLKGAALRSVGYELGSCPNAEWISDRIVSLPTGPQTGRRQVERAIDYFNR